MDNPNMQDILYQFYKPYLEKYNANIYQTKAIYHIMNCKTGEFGVNYTYCSECGYTVPHNNSCRDRSCPMCQALSNEMWVDSQREHILDIPYYHVVMTCPCELYPLIYCNQRELYSLLFHSAAETLMELAEDPVHIGGKPGFISILHTWGSDLSYHPHLHIIITGGGLDSNREWHDGRNGYLFPGAAMAKLFKGKFMSGLKDSKNTGKLVFTGGAKNLSNPYDFQQLLDTCYGKRWVTDIRESFASAETVMHYLGRYTHRIAIGNSRILRMDEETVTFKIKDYKNEGKWKEITISGIEFVRRFLMHIPPKGFIRIRHYGLLSNRNKKTLIPFCRNLIGCKKFLARFKGNDKPTIIKKLYGKDVSVCPCCGGTMGFYIGSLSNPAVFRASP